MAQLPVLDIPKLTTTERDAQDSNFVGEMILNTTTDSLEIDKDGLGTWSRVLDSNMSSNQQFVYISNLGSDTTGNGTITFPYATASYALSQITDSSSSKPYVIVFAPGIYTDTTIALKDFVSFNGNYSYWTITNAVTLDSSFSTGSRNYFNDFYLIYDVAGFNLNFNALAPTSSCTINFMDCGFVIPTFTVTGADSNQCIIKINNVIASATTFALTNCVFSSDYSDIFRITYIKNTTAQPNQSIKLNNSNVLSTSSVTVSVADTIILRSQGVKWLNTLTLTTSGSGVITAEAFASEFIVAPSLSGSGTTLTTDPISVIPSTASGASVVYQVIADTLTANYSPSNYTASNTSVKGNLSGIDTALGAITPASIGALPWVYNEVTGTSSALAAFNEYTANNAALVTLTLPATAAVGDKIVVNGLGAGGWKIAQNASQLINVGSVASTTGVGGSVASINQFDSISLVCVVANTTWNVQASQGNFTIV